MFVLISKTTIFIFNYKWCVIFFKLIIYKLLIWFKYNLIIINKMSVPIIITYDNEPTKNTEFFIKTLENNRWNYKLIGEGDKWEGFITKIISCSKELGTLPEGQIVVLSDSRDVVCVRSPKAFIDGFNSFNKDIVVSMELFCDGFIDELDNCEHVQCTPLTKYWKHHKITHLPSRKFVNAGLICGKAIALKTMLDWVINNNYNDDQLGIGNYINNFPDRVALDTEADILHTSCAGVNACMFSIHVQKRDSPSLMELFGRGAFFLHIPGIINKGQKMVYNSVCNIIESGVCCKMLTSEYNYNEPEWDEKF